MRASIKQAASGTEDGGEGTCCHHDPRVTHPPASMRRASPEPAPGTESRRGEAGSNNRNLGVSKALSSYYFVNHHASKPAPSYLFFTSHFASSNLFFSISNEATSKPSLIRKIFVPHIPFNFCLPSRMRERE